MSESFQLALVSPRLDGESTAVRYWAKLLPFLREEIEVDVFVAPNQVSDGYESIAELHPRRYQQILYVVEDSSECGFMARAIRGIGGTVDLFSWDLGRFAAAAWPELNRGGTRSFLRAVREGGLSEALAWRKQPAAPSQRFNRTVVRHGDAFIVRDEQLGGRIRDERNENTAVGAVRNPELAPEYKEDRVAARRELGLPEPWDSKLVVGWFSPLHPRKRELLNEAVRIVKEQVPELCLLGIGRPSKSDAALQLVEAGEAWRVLSACDVAVHLPRDPKVRTTGELCEALAHGRCVATTQTSESSLPANAVRRCAEDARAIADALLPLLEARAARAAGERDAFEYMNEDRRWRHVAQLYAQFLQSFPEPRAARRSLIAARIREAERRSAAASRER